jgi:hypothetical protein
VGFIVHPCVGCDPVHFPSLASIGGKSLFKPARSRRDVRYNKSDEDGSAIESFPVVKLATSLLKFADRRWAEGTVATAGKIKAPLMGLRIIEPQVHTFKVTLRAIGVEFDQIRAAVPNLADDGSSVKIFDPVKGCKSRER